MKTINLISAFLLMLTCYTSVKAQQVINLGNTINNVSAVDGIIDGQGNHISLLIMDDDLRIACQDKNFVSKWVFGFGAKSLNANAGQIVELSDGTFLCVVHQDENSNFQMLKFDVNGKILWHKKTFYEDTDFHSRSISSIAELSNGNICIVGNYDGIQYITTLDSSCNVLWSKKIIPPSSYDSKVKFVLPTNDGNIMVFSNETAFSNLPHIVLTKFALDGTFLWDKTQLYAMGVEGITGAVQSSVDSSFIAIGNYTPTNGNYSQLDVMARRFDKNGEFISSKLYGFDYMDVAKDIKEDRNGEFIIMGNSKPVLVCGGNLFVLKIDHNLDTIYTKYYGNPSGSGASYSNLHKRADSQEFYTYGSGSLWSTPNFGGHLLKTNSNFELPCKLFNQTTNVSDHTPAYVQTPATNYSAFTFSFIDVDLKDQSTISAIDACSGEFLNIGEQKEISDFKIFPNPAKEEVSIILDGTDTKITITDVTGKQIYNTETMNSELKLNVSTFPKGLYFVKVSTSNYQQTKRLIVN